MAGASGRDGVRRGSHAEVVGAAGRNRYAANPFRVRSTGPPRRVAMLSMHTSPLEQPGTGDAGGMNVYVVELARQLAALGIEVEIFTRATSSGCRRPSNSPPASPSGT